MKQVIFSHGMESGPWGTKIVALADIAKSMGWCVESIDYQPELDPDKRVEKLLDALPEDTTQVVLVGSSMGGYVSAVAAMKKPVLGLFLLAPAFYMPIGQCQDPIANSQYAKVIHGWNDDVIPAAHAIRFCEKNGVELSLLNDSHRLVDELEEVAQQFKHFLTRAA